MQQQQREPPPPHTIVIIGAGITGLCLLLLLEEAGHPLETVAIIDPTFLGGDLVTEWGPVQSNTPWQKTLDALRSAAPSLSLSRLERRLGDIQQSCPLSELGLAIRELARPALDRVVKIQGLATRAEYSSAERVWSVGIVAGQHARGRALVFAQGATPKALDVGLPAIPLSIALDSRRLKEVVRAGDNVLVFGTMHSGTLVIRNLIEGCGASVMALYAGTQPFTWSRDGAYDGIKREAADIADRIVAGEWSNRLQVVAAAQEVDKVLRFSRGATAVVYAMGFKPREGITLQVDGSSRNLTAYDGATGAIKDAPAAWGFGVAYPNQAPDGIHWDVSVAAFLAHMKRQLPAILSHI
jgi:cation diffusion facilitator CzcD-associated flavoprotein CzcO